MKNLQMLFLATAEVNVKKKNKNDIACVASSARSASRQTEKFAAP
jgi:hypothetical protein